MQRSLQFTPLVEISDDRYNALQNDTDDAVVLTDEERAGGWHFCYEWDGMLIRRDWPEAQCCKCFDETEEDP